MLMNRFLPLTFAFPFICVNLIAAAPPRGPGLADAIARGRAIVGADIAPQVPGFAVAVAVDGKIVWSEGFGYADLAAKIPATPDTRFRIGSASKPLTSVGLALLVERGRIDLDAPVQDYIPDFPEKEGVITTRLLAGHLSGIRNYRGMEMLSDRPFPDLRSGLRIFEDDPLVAPPDTKFSYCSYNWNVIGVVMERAAKEEFLQYMQDCVFKPLGMAHTRPDRAGAVDPLRTRFYEVDPAGKFITAPPVDSSYKWPSGGFLSTAEDLARCGSALLQPGFLKPESLKLLFTSQRTSAGKLTNYGIGWFVGRTMAYHGGDIVGGTSILLLLPSSQTVVAMACNRGPFTVGEDAGHAVLRKSAGRYSSAVLKKDALQIAKIFGPLSVIP